MVKRLLANLMPPTSGTRFDALDGLRGLACLAVVFAHAPFYNYFTYRGGVAVCIFYVLSAFLLFYPHAIGKPQPVKDYYFRRFLRIYPAYIVALVFGIFVFEPAAGNIISHLSFTHTFTKDSHTLIAPAWSLPAEMQFYFLLPLLAWVVRQQIPLCLSAFIILGVTIQCFGKSLGNNLPFTMNWPYLALPFFFGMLAAYMVGKDLKYNSRFLLVGIALFAAYIYFLKTFSAYGESSRLLFPLFQIRGLLPSLFVSLIIVGLSSTKSGVWFSIFSCRPMRLLGIFGYGIFLFHAPIFALLGKSLPPFAAFAIGLPLSIVVGAASFIFIESPFMKLRLNQFPRLLALWQRRPLVEPPPA